MSVSFADEGSSTEGAAFPWILEHLLTYPGTYEIPLRTMYTLNAATQSPQPPSSGQTSPVAGNAFPRENQAPTAEDQRNLSTITAAAQLRANLMSHISQLPSQPCSLPPSFVTTFVRRCFTPTLDQVDFPQALTAMDYLKDLEIRRRKEVVAAMDKLGVERDDLGHKDQLTKKYPGVLRWLLNIEEKERKVEALYTQVYIGLRRWTLINELSLTPFNKPSCIAMLNTLYPPVISPNAPFVQPTAQLTPQILSTQRKGFFRYITAVERKGTSVLTSLMDQHKRSGESTGWVSLRETLDNYLVMANAIIDECYEITGRGSFSSPTAPSFSSAEADKDSRRKVDSGVSFATGSSSCRDSALSHNTRPSTSSSFSTGSRRGSKDKQLPEKPLPIPDVQEGGESPEAKTKPAGSTLERIARELRKIRNRSNSREESHAVVPIVIAAEDTVVSDPIPKDRTLRLKRSLKNLRFSGALRDRDPNVRPNSRGDDSKEPGPSPSWDAEMMKKERLAWEKRQGNRESSPGPDFMDLS